MMPVAEDIARHLAVSGVGTFADADVDDWGVYAHKEPETPDRVVTVYETGGSGLDTDEMDLDNVGFQVRARGRTYAEAYAKQETAMNLLLLPGRVVTANSSYLSIDMTSTITPIGRDDNKRFLLTANYRAIRERV